MLWFTVWTLLVVGTLVGAFVLGRDLWRKARALMAELERAAQVVQQLSERVAELAEAAERAPAHPVEPVDLTDATRARERLAVARVATARRRAARAERHAAVYARWRSFSR